MTGLPGLGLGLVVVLGLALGPAQGATAADSAGTITYSEATPDGLQALVSVPADAEVDLDGVQVTVDGEVAEATAVPAGSADALLRTTVMAIDTSNSMKGERFAAAKAAAREFIETAPDNVFLGIVTFDSDVETALPPTQDRASALAVIDQLELRKKTLLYDGVLSAVAEVGSEGQRNVLVLSDGADTTDTPIETVTKAIEDAEVRVDVVALDQDGEALSALETLAAAGGGEVIPADPAALTQAFAEQAAALARQVLVTVVVPRSVEATEATLQITLPTADGTLTAEAFTTVRSTPISEPLVKETPWSPPTWVVYAGPAAVGLGLVLAVFLLLPKSKTVTAADRVSQYTASQSKSAGAGAGPLLDTDVAFASAKETAANMLRRNQDLDARISRRLEAAGSELKSSEWLLLHGAIFFVCGLAGIGLGGGNPVVGLLFLAAGLFLPWMYLGFRRSRRRKAFNASLPDTLQLMSGSLAAGLSLAQSVDTIVREGSEPIAGEFRRVLVETRLGVSLEDALEGIGERFESKDFEWVVMAIKIQRQVGGNLGELLDSVAATMREREYVRRQVAALAAEGKLSAWVLGGLPPLFMLYLFLTNRDYVIVMFQEPLGWAMLAGAATILAIGVFWMSRLVKVEV
ncbi:type II secretion system F family protein [Nocardioides sp.]|uniref:type II secretion system F family protein n=1 Tax=Nocardioides sp. TaxID=35761 RepID=UPI001A2EAD49|nr:type II secretion system F family protein [Nocardioides sp.]MBJ7356240.1 type II secretion system F family protein [Nocardioides sp.]